MMSQVYQVEFLRQQNLNFNQISKLLDAPALEVYNAYKYYILPFNDTFNSIVDELTLREIEACKKECQDLVYYVRSKIKPLTKFRNVWLLTPVVVFTFLRSKGILVKAADLCRASAISLSDFKEGMLIVHGVCNDFLKRDRKAIVLRLIDKMVSQFNLDEPFLDTTRTLFKKYYSLFKNTKDNIVAGLILALSFVVQERDTRIISEVFKALGTSVPCAHYHINRKIFAQNQLGEFRGFAKSGETLKKFLINGR